MKDCALAVLAILGTIIGSGFISGKEISVFFSRFGSFSFLSIIIAFILFFLLFKMILGGTEKAIKRLEESKIVFAMNTILCLIFSSAMFAGVGNILSNNTKLGIIAIFLIIFLCSLVFAKGLGSLNKLNLLIVPLMIIVFVALILTKLNFSFQPLAKQTDFAFPSIVYSILYVVLNVANGGTLIARVGKNLSSRQKTQVAFISALALFIILLIANLVLLLNPSSLSYAMPILSLFSSFRLVLMTFVVFSGCVTTLLTLVYTISSSMRGLCKNEFLNYFTSIILPLLLSLVGFDFIVEYLYPLASVLGIYLLCDLFFVPFFKRAYKKIHSASKHT